MLLSVVKVYVHMYVAYNIQWLICDGNSFQPYQ